MNAPKSPINGSLPESVLIANRGEIARRIIRTCDSLGIRSIAVYSEADESALHVSESTDSVAIGPATPSESYLDIERVIDAAKTSGAHAIHPGYGFLSESSEFARRIRDAGLIWIGPDPGTIEIMGDKVNARNVMAEAGVPVSPGSSRPITDVEEALVSATSVGFPLMVKAAAGGGGIGMAIANDAAELTAVFESVASRGARFFGDAAILLERYIPRARHVEVQILGLANGQILAVGERDCSVQRRHQKVLEETPSPGVTNSLRLRMYDAAVKAAEAVNYRGAGTVEFLVFEGDSGPEFVFLEMNTRLQVEHPITELTTGIDLVAEQIRVAANCGPGFDPTAVEPSGHAVELRVYAEDPKRFLPRPGTITRWDEPTGDGIRVDAGYGSGDTVTPFYDPLLAKLCIWARTRDEALSRARLAVSQFCIEGVQTNLPFFVELLNNEDFASGQYDTRLIERMQAGE